MNCILITPRKTANGGVRNSAAMATIIQFGRDNKCDSGSNPLRRHESADEEVQIAKEAKGLLIGLAIIVAVLAISVLVAKLYFSRL